MNVHNQTVFIGDNLDIMRGLNSGIANLICADPPFNKNKKFNHNFGNSGKTRAGKVKPGFDDAWTMDDVKEAEHELLSGCHPDLYHVCLMGGKMHSEGMRAYLIMMSTRLLECRRLLSETGSMYLHCDHSANAYLRLLMDGVFGQQNFRNQIAWWYKNASRGKYNWAKSHDTILYYAKNAEHVKFNRDAVLVPFESGMTAWRYSKGGQADKEMPKGKTPDNVICIPSLNTMAKERSGWATQKPLALYSQLVLASSDPGDLVLDPFCGCATTLVAAENAGRQWVGIDRDEEAENQVKIQLDKLNEQQVDWWRKVIVRTDIPQRTDEEPIPNYRKHFSDLYTEQNGVCRLCKYKRDAHWMEIDHIVPKSKGGSNHKSNLQILCRRCNSLKGNLKWSEAIAKAKKLKIINPEWKGSW